MINLKNYKLVKLHPISENARKVISYYKNELFLKEYDDYGRPLGIAPNGKPGIFCVSKDLFWNGWFILDEDVLFENEAERIRDLEK
jgi:hypothetical protein